MNNLSEEEKKAIEHIKNYPKNWLFEEVNEMAIKVALNLIEKQSKEIEDLKAIINTDNIINKARAEVIEQQQKEIEDLRQVAKQLNDIAPDRTSTVSERNL